MESALMIEMKKERKEW